MLHAGVSQVDISVKTDIVVSSMNCHAADNSYRAKHGCYFYVSGVSVQVCLLSVGERIFFRA